MLVYYRFLANSILLLIILEQFQRSLHWLHLLNHAESRLYLFENQMYQLQSKRCFHVLALFLLNKTEWIYWSNQIPGIFSSKFNIFKTETLPHKIFEKSICLRRLTFILFSMLKNVKFELQKLAIIFVWEIVKHGNLSITWEHVS